MEASEPPASSSKYPSLEVITYTGSGDDVVEIQSIKDGYVFRISGNQAGRHFAVKGYDEAGNPTELFVNTTDPYSGITIDETLTTRTLEISSAGEWAVELVPLSMLDCISTGQTFSGSGDNVLIILDCGTKAEITGNDEGRHFAVKSYGNSINLLVNTTDPYSGTVMLKGSPVLFEITAVGSWTITL